MDSHLQLQQRVDSWLASSAQPTPKKRRLKDIPHCAVPLTPPDSHAEPSATGDEVDIEALALEKSPTKRQRLNAHSDSDLDPDQTPRSLHHRPILRPVSPRKKGRQSRTPSPKHRPITTTYDLQRLEKPVKVLLGSGRSSLPPNVKDLIRSIQNVESRQVPFIPAEVQQEVAAIMKYRDIGELEEGWVHQNPVDVGSRTPALEELGKILDICRASNMSAEFPRHEGAWNSEVHHPLLSLAFSDADDVRRDEESLRPGRQVGAKPAVRIRVENVTSATIAADYVPRWRPRLAGSAAADMTAPTRRQRDDTGSDTGSVLAWSVHTSSSASSSSNLGEQGASSSGPHHDRTSSKKVDFVVVIEPTPRSSLHAALQAVLAELDDTESQGTRSINPSGYAPLLEAPITGVIEAKAASATRNPLVQLGMIANAIHRRLHTLPVRGAVGASSLTKTGVLMTLPLLAVTDDEWHLYFARDGGSNIVCASSCILRPRRRLIIIP